jgi:hypothetical protein
VNTAKTHNELSQQHDETEMHIHIYIYIYKGKVFPSTGLGSPYGCERLRIPHFLDNRLTDGGKVVRPKHRALFYSPPPRKIPGTHFC